MSTGDAGNAAVAAGGEAANGGEAQQGPDLGQLASSLESMQAGQEELRQFLTSEPWKQTGEPEADGPDGPDLSFLDADDPSFDPAALGERLSALVNEVAQQQIQQHVEPIRQAQENERIAREAQMLVDEFPEMGDPEIGPQVVAAARQVAEANGNPELANQPWFWRTIYMAGRAAQTASEEGGESPSAAHLEGGAGARPGAQQVDLADQIIGSDTRRGRGALPFG